MIASHTCVYEGEEGEGSYRQTKNILSKILRSTAEYHQYEYSDIQTFKNI